MAPTALLRSRDNGWLHTDQVEIPSNCSTAIPQHQILMRAIQRYQESELQQVVEKLAPQLSFKITDPDIEAAFAELSLPKPIKAVSSHIRKLVIERRDKTLEVLCEKLSKKFHSEPKPRDLIVALEAAGYNHTRALIDALMNMLRTQNAERWTLASAPKKRTVRLSEGEVEMWDALQRTYNMNADATASMLLRLFAAVTSTGKVPYLDVPFVASALTDASLKRYAQSLNFSIKKSRKSRV